MEELKLKLHSPIGEDCLHVISSLSFLNDLPFVEDLIETGKISLFRYQPNEMIYSRKTYQKALAVIVSGSASVMHDPSASRVTIRLLEKGDIFGVAALFSDETQYVSEIVARDECTVAFLSQESISFFFLNHPHAAIAYITLLSRKIRFLNERLDSFTAPNALTQICLYLAENGNMTISMQAFADRLGISRMTLYRNLDLLVNNGCISREGKTITVLDREALLDVTAEKIL